MNMNFEKYARSGHPLVGKGTADEGRKQGADRRHGEGLCDPFLHSFGPEYVGERRQPESGGKPLEKGNKPEPCENPFALRFVFHGLSIAGNECEGDF
jgi:hypothetical protein|tara:strand:+ start:1149 stop:1439 length:291 start_codon:yes stop_codon:yes gene_type:complete